MSHDFLRYWLVMYGEYDDKDYSFDQTYEYNEVVDFKLRVGVPKFTSC